MSESIVSAGGKKFLASHGVDSPAALLLPASSAVILPPARHKALERSDRRWKDSLTGLASSQTILTAIDRVTRTVDPKSQDATLLYVDLDAFREVNDNFGQEIGDRLLREVATRLRKLFPGVSLVARIFGDDFALLLRGAPPTPGSPRLATLQRCFETPFVIGDLEITIGASIGGIVLADSKTPAAEA
ncbi:MAG: GGDEF domain-containing protein, partial [Chthoniobacterales bacterium]